MKSEECSCDGGELYVLRFRGLGLCTFRVGPLGTMTYVMYRITRVLENLLSRGYFKCGQEFLPGYISCVKHGGVAAHFPHQ